jgi:CHAT domain-containing protein/tetratricopeptide (TPR) repeat protein
VAVAIPIAEREVALRRAQANALEVAAALHDLGVYLTLGGQYDRARAGLNEALTLRRAAPINTSVLVSETLLALVPLLPGDQSRAAADEAYRLRRAAFGDNSPEAAAARYWLSLGDEAALREVLAIQQNHLGPDHADIARTLRALSGTRIGEHGRNEQLSRQSLAMLRRIHGPDDPRLYDGLFDLAHKLRAVGETQEAIDLLAEALAIYEQQFDVHPRLISCRNGIAIMSNDLQRYADAERLMRRNARDCRILYPDDSVQSAFVTNNLALTCMFLGQCARADSLLDEAAARARVLQARGEDVEHLVHTNGAYRGRLATWCGRYAEAEKWMKASLDNTLVARKYPPGHEQIVKGYQYLGEARAGARDFAGAEAYFDEAVKSYETVRPLTGAGSRPAAFQKTPYEFRALVRLAMDRPEAAWQDIERSRGRLLSDSLLGHAFPFPLSRVQRSLAPDEAIVGWVDHELPEGRPQAHAYVIRATGPVAWTTLPGDPNERVFSRASRYRAFRSVIAEAGYSAFARDFPRADATRLWHERIAPLSAHLGGVHTLIVIPSDAMASLPIDALVDDRGAFVGETYAIRQAPSASVYAWLCEQSRGGEPVARSGLLVGDPPFREEHLAAWKPATMDVASRGAVAPATLRGAVKGDAASLEALPRLPWSREEVHAIEKVIPKTTTLLGKDASRASIERLAARDELARFDVIHFATHALVDDVRPEHSALVLAQVGGKKRGAGDAGVVTAEEIDHWRLDAELVTLSACETALGRNVFGEGTIGFAYPLLRAGSRSLLASRWPVNDEATALLMGRFYAKWLGAKGTTPMNKAEALREARTWLRAWTARDGSRPYEHPYYWASFVLVGR